MSNKLSQKSCKKIPSFLAKEHFLFPDSLSAEQATDEIISRFHTSLIGSGKNIVDLTAGLGIDSFTMSMAGNHVSAIEIIPDKAAAIKYNSRILGLSDYKIYNMDCLDYLKQDKIEKDCFFIDPARRDNNNRRAYNFHDCLPDVTLFYKRLLEKGEEVFIKASPLLDIKATISEFDFLKEIYSVSLRGECKEILIHLKKNYKESPRISAIELDNNGVVSSFSFLSTDHPQPVRIISDEKILPGDYLYEPNTALMKLHAGGEICNKYNVLKLGKNTELYISSKLIKDFPGRIIKIDNILTSRDLKKMRGRNFSIVSRNFPIKADDLRKKINSGESSIDFLYAFRLGISEKPLIISGKKIEVEK